MLMIRTDGRAFKMTHYLLSPESSILLWLVCSSDESAVFRCTILDKKTQHVKFLVVVNVWVLVGKRHMLIMD